MNPEGIDYRIMLEDAFSEMDIKKIKSILRTVKKKS
jgi:hypothetical protein